MSRALRLPSWLSAPQPEVAIEVAAGRVSVAKLSPGSPSSVTSFAVEPLPADAVVPALAAKNIANPRVVSEAVKRAIERAGVPSPARVAIVMPEIGLDDEPIRPVMRDETVAKKKPKMRISTAAITLP